jgi:hypothetical protein
VLSYPLMFDLDLAIRTLAGVALVCFLTPALRPLGLSPRMAQMFRRAALVVLGLAMFAALIETFNWFIAEPG